MAGSFVTAGTGFNLSPGYLTRAFGPGSQDLFDIKKIISPQTTTEVPLQLPSGFSNKLEMLNAAVPSLQRLPEWTQLAIAPALFNNSDIATQLKTIGPEMRSNMEFQANLAERVAQGKNDRDMKNALILRTIDNLGKAVRGRNGTKEELMQLAQGPMDASNAFLSGLIATRPQQARLMLPPQSYNW
jgi:hypothetical protein